MLAQSSIPSEPTHRIFQPLPTPRGRASRAEASGPASLSDVALLKCLRKSGDWLYEMCRRLFQKRGLKFPNDAPPSVRLSKPWPRPAKWGNGKSSWSRRKAACAAGSARFAKARRRFIVRKSNCGDGLPRRPTSCSRTLWSMPNAWSCSPPLPRTSILRPQCWIGTGCAGRSS